MFYLLAGCYVDGSVHSARRSVKMHEQNHVSNTSVYSIQNENSHLIKKFQETFSVSQMGLESHSVILLYFYINCRLIQRRNNTVHASDLLVNIQTADVLAY